MSAHVPTAGGWLNPHRSYSVVDRFYHEDGTLEREERSEMHWCIWCHKTVMVPEESR